MPAPAVASACCPYGENVADTDFADVMDTVQVAFGPLHAPAQPTKLDPASGVATRTTDVPAAYAPPDGATEPDPVTVTVSGYICVANVATTLFAASIITTHEPVPEQPPPVHPVNVNPEGATAVRVTVCPTE